MAKNAFADYDDSPELWRNWRHPGPKAKGWALSKAPMHFIIGPVGSAKTSEGAMKCLDVARRQNPTPRRRYWQERFIKPGHPAWENAHPVRMARIAAIRMNYRRMWDTLIPSYYDVFGHQLGAWKTEANGPADHKYEIFDQRYGLLQVHVQFRSLGDQDLESFIRGFQVTAFWLNEADELPPESPGLFYQRTGRYPSPADRPENPDEEAWNGVFGDMNMPDEDNWFYVDYMQNTPDGCEIFIQPSGFDPNAENLSNLLKIKPNYYRDKAKLMKPWEIRRFLENKPGFSRSGSPVYDNFVDLQDGGHVGSEDMGPEPGARLIIGVDQGLKSAVTINQATSTGHFLTLHEIVTEPDTVTGGKEQGERTGRLLLAEYPKWANSGNFVVIADPAAKQRNSSKSSFYFDFCAGLIAVLNTAPVQLAPTNSVEARVGAVRDLLAANTRDGQRVYRIHPRCRYLRRGFVGGYKIERVQGKPGQFKDQPAKNEYADPHDALQYAALTVKPEKLKTVNPAAPAAQKRVGAVRSVQVTM